MHKRSINLEENYFFDYLMEIDLGNQNKTKKHACLRNINVAYKTEKVYVFFNCYETKTIEKLRNRNS